MNDNQQNLFSQHIASKIIVATIAASAKRRSHRVIVNAVRIFGKRARICIESRRLLRSIRKLNKLRSFQKNRFVDFRNQFQNCFANCDLRSANSDTGLKYTQNELAKQSWLSFAITHNLSLRLSHHFFPGRD